MATTTLHTQPAAPGRRWGLIALLGVAGLAGLVFVVGFALPYFALDPEHFGPHFWPRRGRLLVHVAGGIVALMTGPFQLWMGLTGRRMRLHRALGKVYMAAVAVSSLAAFYLALTTQVGWVFAAGLGGLGLAWVVTTGLAYISIRKGLLEQHKEWMIRSYVVTFGFVFFRIFVGATEAAGVGTLPDRLAAASWFCWAVPLLINEAILQGRKIFSVRSPRVV